MNTTTLEKMRKMKFFGMLNAFKGNLESATIEACTPDELIATLIESEWDDRQNRKIERHLKNVFAIGGEDMGDNGAAAGAEGRSIHMVRL